MAAEMSADRALILTRAWAASIGESLENMTVSPNGDFRGLFGAAEIVYSSRDKMLSAMGLVDIDATPMLEDQEFFDEMKRTGEREPSTMGEGYFYIEKTPFNARLPQLTLRKDFTNAMLEPKRFILEVDWLMEWATYWRKIRSVQVVSKPEEELIREAAGIEEWVKKNRPRPW